MLTGRETLRTFDSTLDKVRNEIDRLDKELNRAVEAAAANKREQAQVSQRLAAIRLDAMARGELVDSLGSADRQAKEILEKRGRALIALEQQIDEQLAVLRNEEQKRETCYDEVNQCSQAVIDAENIVQTALESDDEYQQYLRAAKEANAIADSAEEKSASYHDELADKEQPYKGDPLFNYLWERGYGTTQYSVFNPIIRLLDGWVARLCGYKDARVNYWNLQEIPKRLAKHADYVRQVSNDSIEQLRAYEMQKSEQANIPTLQDDLANKREVLDKIDERIAEIEQKYEKLLSERAQFVEGDDKYMKESLSVLGHALNRRRLYDLHSMSDRTRTREDDLLVDELEDLREEEDRLRHSVKEHRRVHNAQIKRLKELSDVRKRFKKKRYDDVRSGFDGDDLISIMLSQFLKGLIGGTELWRVLERNQRHIDVGAWPDFGSGGLGGRYIPGRKQRRRRTSTWHWPGASSGGFRLPRSGGFSSRGSGGGFRTGGGF